MISDPRKVAILIFDDVEVLDFCGPFEVFSVTGLLTPPPPFSVYTVAETAGPITARNGLSVNPRYTTRECPAPDILLIPGGMGTRREIHNRALTDWIARRAEQVELILSVCTGALLLAKAGLLDGLEATTHHGALDLLRQHTPRTKISPEKRFIDNGKVIVSAGISAGIDMSLYVVGRLLGEDEALQTARYMEYDWKGIEASYFAWE
ncbi:MAG: DJ-1/PfpI family protein [Deltaproteobacteria bacterium]|nr:DJ-1/PfpI family protein [Deltaproteobacteria bacterium]